MGEHNVLGLWGWIGIGGCGIRFQARYIVSFLAPLFGIGRVGANCVRRIQTWALEEARRRLEAEGILKEPETKE